MLKVLVVASHYSSDVSLHATKDVMSSIRTMHRANLQFVSQEYYSFNLALEMSLLMPFVSSVYR